MNIWQTIQSEIQNATQTPFLLSEKIPLTGGDINQAFRLIGGECEYFVKLNSSAFSDMFIRESSGLKVLENTESFVIPKVIIKGVFENQSYLVLEFISMHRHGDIVDFAEALANFHLTTQEEFGFKENNYIGRTAQENQFRSNWGEFFAEQRIRYQLELLGQKNVPHSLIKKGLKLVQKLPDYLNKHQPKPALVHGDLWQGNYAFNQVGAPVIFDPACYYADHEVDLAMLLLFGHPGQKFFDTYNRFYPIAPGFSSRKKIYNLYHILNHANLFSGSYIAQADQIIVDLLLSINSD